MRLPRAGVSAPAVHVTLAVLSAALVSGCSVLGGTSSGSSSVTVAVVPGIDSAPLSVAVQEGTFQRHGLHVTVRDYPSLDAEFQALASGQAQVAAGDYTDFLYEQASGRASLQLIADGYDTTSNSVAILTLPGSGITAPQQLEGLSGGVATPPAQVVPYSQTVPYNFETLAAEEVLQSDGVSPSSVNWKQMPPAKMIGALRSGEVKAILATEPYILQAEEQLGAVEVADASSGVTSQLPMSGYFSLASYARANPSAVQAFQDALSQGQSDAAQRGTVQALLPQVAGMSKGDAALVTLGTYPASLNVGQVQRVATLMYDSGMITDPLTVSSLASR
jgi:ABC-type nitrate/sulfonate/bicarbonate transport system substrate-binding protein